MIGITSYGAYIPYLRLNRMAIYQNMGWFAPALIMAAQGERSMSNWDEDAVTMAVAASQDCLNGIINPQMEKTKIDKSQIDALYVASTTFPFADRQNAGIVATALNLNPRIFSADVTSTQKAGTDALIAALEAVKSQEKTTVLVTASDQRQTKTGSFYEMWFGDGAASVLVGQDNVIAEFLGSFSVTYDFVSHFRSAGHKFDRTWEERWVRDEGYSKIIPEAINGVLEKTNLQMNQVNKLIFPCIFKAEHRKIAKKLGADPQNVTDNLHDVCGETGAAHPLLMLAQALETAKPGDIMIVAGFGQGCNAIAFRITDNMANFSTCKAVSGHLSHKKVVETYPKWLKFRELIDPEMGIRAEAQQQTALSVLYRKRKMLYGLVGGRCQTCDTPQFPKMDICVNPNCGAVKTQTDYEFASVPAKIKTFTGDLLAVSVDPPHMYGMIQFEGGGRFMADFTDCQFEQLKVGLPMRMVFRKRTKDPEKGFINYFWKGTPVPGAEVQKDPISFKGQVAIITGAGGGLGKTYALELARRGVKVVVNDLGGARDGAGQGSSAPADQVVAEIKQQGGEAISNYDDISTAKGGENLVNQAVAVFGRVDIVINNAGILRDKSLVKMDPESWQKVLDVHLNGAFHVTQPAYKIMKENKYGRILFTTSAAGLYGNFGQANYSAAKMGLVGLMNSLQIEAAKYNIKANTIAPLAASRLTEDIMPPDMFAQAAPESIVPLVVYLVSSECENQADIFNAGFGVFNRVAVMTGQSIQLSQTDETPTPELVKNRIKDLKSLENRKIYVNLTDAMMDFLTPPQPERDTASAGSNLDLDIETVLKEIMSKFQPDQADGIEVVFQFTISGDLAGKWFFYIKDKSVALETGQHDKPTCTFKMEDQNFIAMLKGELQPMQAYSSGKLKIEGDIMKSQLFSKLFTI